ncbi:hypothetical protein [Gulosibacter sp. 10]|uniref:hypothetical protein n=1 Tax=Gulosibacter sp. 10 TaxID=1255570 RepID=UPI000B355CB2|nr:hypothetical protein [Gulosibacter sp. 10]
MNDSQERELVEGVEAAVLGVAGVTAVFFAGSRPSRVVDAGVRLLGFRERGAPLVRFERFGDECRVDVAIGVRAAAGVVDTALRVRAAIESIFAESGALRVEARVTVVHVDDT